MYVLTFVILTTILISAVLSLGVEKKVEKNSYIDEFTSTKSKEFLQKIPNIYDKTYNLLHLSNYRHYVEQDGFRYKDIILLNNKLLCDIDSEDGYKIDNCRFYQDDENLSDDDLRVMYEFLPPPTNSLRDLTGVIFLKNSFIPTINDIKIPRMIIEFAEIEKISGKGYNIKHLVRADTYRTVDNKIEIADNILDNVSQYVRQYAKTKFKISNYNPFVSEYGLTKLYYTDIDNDTVSTTKKLVRLKGSLGYGLITSKMKMLPNSNSYKMSVNKFTPIIETGSNIWDAYFNNNYNMSDWDSYNGIRILYSLTYLDGNSIYDDKWYDDYDYYGIYSPFYNILDRDTFLVGLDEHAALKKEVSVLNHVKVIDLKVKTVRDYFKDKFNLEFSGAFFVNPFYGDKYPFNILIDNSSNLTYPVQEVNNETYKIMNRYKITFALPYIVDHIDNGNIIDDNPYKGIYYRTYVITTVK